MFELLNKQKRLCNLLVTLLRTTLIVTMPVVPKPYFKVLMLNPKKNLRYLPFSEIFTHFVQIKCRSK